jgi:glucose-1-phosphate thymidylyltransferase
MKAIILAGGFGRRMWPLTLERPKCLLTVGGKPVIEHVTEKLLNINEIHTIYITVNKLFEDAFREWLNSQGYNRDIRLVVEESLKNDEKLGSLGAIKHLIDREAIDDDILCVAGDNIFQDNLHSFLEFFKQQNKFICGLYEMDKAEELTGYGISILDDSGMITDFEEKPENPKSNLVSTGIYAIPRNVLQQIQEYMKAGHNPDAFGYFISWLHKKTSVSGFVFKNKWFDIGSFETLRKADEFLSQESQSP